MGRRKLVAQTAVEKGGGGSGGGKHKNIKSDPRSGQLSPVKPLRSYQDQGKIKQYPLFGGDGNDRGDAIHRTAPYPQTANTTPQHSTQHSRVPDAQNVILSADPGRPAGQMSSQRSQSYYAPGESPLRQQRQQPVLPPQQQQRQQHYDSRGPTLSTVTSQDFTPLQLQELRRLPQLPAVVLRHTGRLFAPPFPFPIPPGWNVNSKFIVPVPAHSPRVQQHALSAPASSLQESSPVPNAVNSGVPLARTQSILKKSSSFKKVAPAQNFVQQAAQQQQQPPPSPSHTELLPPHHPVQSTANSAMNLQCGNSGAPLIHTQSILQKSSIFKKVAPPKPQPPRVAEAPAVPPVMATQSQLPTAANNQVACPYSDSSRTGASELSTDSTGAETASAAPHHPSSTSFGDSGVFNENQTVMATREGSTDDVRQGGSLDKDDLAAQREREAVKRRALLATTVREPTERMLAKVLSGEPAKRREPTIEDIGEVAQPSESHGNSQSSQRAPSMSSSPHSFSSSSSVSVSHPQPQLRVPSPVAVVSIDDIVISNLSLENGNGDDTGAARPTASTTATAVTTTTIGAAPLSPLLALLRSSLSLTATEEIGATATNSKIKGNSPCTQPPLPRNNVPSRAEAVRAETEAQTRLKKTPEQVNLEQCQRVEQPASSSSTALESRDLGGVRSSCAPPACDQKATGTQVRPLAAMQRQAPIMKTHRSATLVLYANAGGDDVDAAASTVASAAGGAIKCCNGTAQINLPGTRTTVTFTVDELVSLPSAPGISIKSELIDKLRQVFLSGRSTAMLSVDDNVCCAVDDVSGTHLHEPFASPIWRLKRQMMENALRDVERRRGRGADMELAISFALICSTDSEAKESSNSSVEEEVVGVTEVVDMLANEAHRGLRLRMVRSPLYGHRIGGVEYRVVHSVDEFEAAILAAQSNGLRFATDVAALGTNMVEVMTAVLIHKGEGLPVRIDANDDDDCDAIAEYMESEEEDDDTILEPVTGMMPGSAEDGDLIMSTLTCVGVGGDNRVLEFVLRSAAAAKYSSGGGIAPTTAHRQCAAAYPLLREIIGGTVYTSVVAALDVQQEAGTSRVPSALMATVTSLAAFPRVKPLNGSARRHVERLRHENALAERAIELEVSGSAAQRSYKLAIKRNLMALAEIKTALSTPRDRRFSIQR